MKYIGLSGILVALLLTVGCGSKNVDSKGEVDAKKQTREPVASGGAGAQVNAGGASAGSSSRNEGRFMPFDNNGGDGRGQGSGQGAYGGSSSDGSSGRYSSGGSYPGGAPSLPLTALTPIYFEFDRYDIRPDMREYIRANADYIKEHNIKSVVVQGNTDQVGGDEYNLALGQKRALSVRDALVLQGIPVSVFEVVSFGPNKPVCTDNTHDCYAKNRRADIVEKD